MYIGAGVILTNPKQQYILVRDTRSGRWGFPKGHPETRDKKNPVNTAIRECEEETGLKPLVDYVIDISNAKRIGKRLYFYGICNKESFDKASMPAREISDVQWWDFDTIVLNESVMNSDLRCWVKKMRSAKASPKMGATSGVSLVPSSTL
jgi:8-oxo-dGTP pyrophosphatase MutT (NUDIX family)